MWFSMRWFIDDEDHEYYVEGDAESIIYLDSIITKTYSCKYFYGLHERNDGSGTYCKLPTEIESIKEYLEKNANNC